ncbi:histidinol dehydrogenase [Helicobacter sp. MIT 99-5507]|uniref:histidinol dehydrogenase n=1 Tax=Helicobacter sp. MIT 99-5507 TaxID=152489 RepID=UPI000E1F132D|nr:histidinol dehydrogenase [Helicobacter sp. MIT 99-5507]RDU58590.1 histidinol dehydrogenase [Helicobacter sp. MIT 99-5507]
MQILNTKDSDFNAKFNNLLNRGNMDIENVSSVVNGILNDIKVNGNNALLSHIARFDGWNPKNFEDIIIDKSLLQKAYNTLPTDLKNALKCAFERISAFHAKQKEKSWIDFEENGTMLGVKVAPMKRAGLYIPGGKAAYPSSLLMNAIPAIVAGVKEIIVCTPTPENKPNDLLLAAAHICGLEEIYKVGGASAIGFMAYGSESFKKVDVITGPGNIYVATAKKLVFGDVNIDMIAGPSEIGIIADKNANPKYIALDLLSQAEHDEMASSILITDDFNLAKQVNIEVESELKKLSRYEITSKSINNRACIIITQSLQDSIKLMNEIAPEHLEIMCENPHVLLPFIENAGAIFLGENTPEPIGDYIAGPNHTLPTGGSARFFSPLSVEHFVKKSSIISFSKEAILSIGESCAILAENEGLEAHKKSVEIRLGKNDGF